MKRPNIVWLLLDALRYDRVGCCGGSNLTPNIDDIAAESAVYKRCIAQSNYSDPTHSAIFTGLYPFETAAPPAGHGLRSDIPTLAETLKDAGWHTASFSANPILWDTNNHGRGFEETHRIKLFGSESYSAIGRLSAMFLGDKGAHRIARELPEWTARQSNPFFVFANFMDVHQPYGSPYRHSRTHFPGVLGWLRQKLMMLRTMRLHNFIADASTKDVKMLRDLYDTAVKNLDEAVGKCIEGLREAGILDNCILIITSDHGNFLGEKGRVAHNAAIGEHGLHLPLIIRWQDAWTESTTIEQVVEQRAIPFSLGKTLGISGLASSCKDPMNLFDVDNNNDDFAYAERIPLKPESRKRYEEVHPKFDWERYDRPVWVVRTRDWELMDSPSDIGGLFHVKKDHDEEHDLSEKHPEIYSQLNDKLEHMKHLSKQHRTNGEKEESAYTSEERKEVEEHLRSFGYF